MRTIIAIDPGVHGGVAVYDEAATKPFSAFGFDGMSQADIIAEFSVIRQRAGEVVAVLEEIERFMPAMPGASISVYAESYGVLKGALMALGYRLETVRARKWQSGLGLAPERRQKTNGGTPVFKTLKNGTVKPVMEKDGPEWKRTLRARAQQLYPGIAATLQNADALLILEWARRNGI